MRNKRLNRHKKPSDLLVHQNINNISYDTRNHGAGRTSSDREANAEAGQPVYLYVIFTPSHSQALRAMHAEICLTAGRLVVYHWTICTHCHAFDQAKTTPLRPATASEAMVGSQGLPPPPPYTQLSAICKPCVFSPPTEPCRLPCLDLNTTLSSPPS